MNIREFEPKDKDQVLKLFEEFGDFFVRMDKLKLIIRAQNYAEVFFTEMIEHALFNGVIYVAEEDEKVVGFIAGNIKRLTPDNTVENIPMLKGRILEFFVNENFRKKGIGKLLMTKIEDFFKENNCNTINVEVFAQNTNAYKFYSSLGYESRNIDMMKVLKSPLDNLIQ